MKICVQGTWHLGSVTAACLADKGHKVIGLDYDTNVINSLSKGKAPIYEPGLDDLIGKGLAEKRLSFFDRPIDHISDQDILWITYDTPVDDDDQADIEFVFEQVEKTIPYLPLGITVLVSSQMPVGSIRRLEKLTQKNHPELKIGFAYSPENLRLGKAIDIFMNPDRIVVGFRSERDQKKIRKMLLPITEKIEWMTIESAEITKHAINAFLATSITFANEIATVCELTGADAKQVERGLKSEQRIGPKAYLSPGSAFAGGTLARDIQFLNQVGDNEGIKLPLLSSVKPSNDQHKSWAMRRLLAKFSDISGKKITLWGLAYKPGTDTLRRSLAVELANALIEKGVILTIHDPLVKSLPDAWKGKVIKSSHPLDSVFEADALVVTTECTIYKEVEVAKIPSIAPGIMILDANRFLDSLLNLDGIEYISVGQIKKEY
jgi:UDPglucose 6-dehydrogenase